MRNDIRRSVIELDIENQRILDNYKRNVRSFVEKYDTDNFVLGYNNREITEGYFKIRKEFDNLDESLKDLKIGEIIYIKNREDDNRKYIIGEYHQGIVEGDVMSIKSFNII